METLTAIRELLGLSSESDATVLGIAYKERLIDAREYMSATECVKAEERKRCEHV